MSSVALDDQILAALRDAEGFPLSAVSIGKTVNVAPFWVWERLEDLEARALVYRERDLSHLVPGGRSAYWVRCREAELWES
jgi:hypothetical protein